MYLGMACIDGMRLLQLHLIPLLNVLMGLLKSVSKIPLAQSCCVNI